MSAFKIIHVFGFGETQIISDAIEGKVKSSTLTKLQAFVDHIKSLKPADVTLTDFHVIHVFGDREVRYLGLEATDKTATTDFTIPMTNVSAAVLNDLIAELTIAVPAAKAEADAAKATKAAAKATKANKAAKQAAK